MERDVTCFVKFISNSEVFVDLADDLKLPDWFDVNKRDHDLLMRLMDWLLDNAFVLFVKSEVINDFFILHGITGDHFNTYSDNKYII